jgi:hypothetical protein
MAPRYTVEADSDVPGETANVRFTMTRGKPKQEAVRWLFAPLWNSEGKP